MASLSPEMPEPVDAGTSSASKRGNLAALWQRMLFLAVQVVYLRFRYDIFISYRRHYRPYVVKLKQQLEHLGYRAFFDDEECPPGSPLTLTLQRALKRSAALVLLGSQDIDSAYVTMEVTTFGQTGRTIIPIDVGGTLAGAKIPTIHERDLVWVNESVDALQLGVPSAAVIAGIEANFQYLRRNLRQRIEGLLIAVLVAAVAVGSVQYARTNVAIARAQEQAASAAAAAANQQKEEAVRLEAAARRSAYEQMGQRASLMATEPGREHDALLAGVLAVAPSMREGAAPPAAASTGLIESIAAAARSMPVATEWPSDVRLSDDGDQIVSVASDGARWWETETGRMLRHVATPGQDWRVAFCGDSGLVVDHQSWPNNTPQREFRFTDIATGQVSSTVRSGTVRSVAACSRDRKWAVVAQGGQDHLWDLGRQEDLGPLPVPLTYAEPQFSADGTRLASGSGIVEIPSRRLIARFDNPVKLPPNVPIMSPRGFRLVRFFADDRLVAAGSDLGNVTIWTADEGALVSSFVVTEPRYGVKPMATLPTLHQAIVSMAVSPNAKEIAVADINSRISLWSTQPNATQPLRTLNVLADEDAPVRLRITTDDSGRVMFGGVTRVRFFNADTLVFVTETGRVSVRDARTLRKTRAMQDPECFATENADANRSDVQPAFVFDRRGRQLVTFGCFAGMRRWSFDKDLLGGRFKELSRLFERDNSLSPWIDPAASSRDPASHVQRACTMLRAADLAQAAEWCKPQ